VPVFFSAHTRQGFRTGSASATLGTRQDLPALDPALAVRLPPAAGDNEIRRSLFLMFAPLTAFHMAAAAIFILDQSLFISSLSC